MNVFHRKICLVLEHVSINISSILLSFTFNTCRINRISLIWGYDCLNRVLKKITEEIIYPMIYLSYQYS